ncbi:hypothetical protein MXB_1367 [Myxobolus squamalis]|nr:hypothetical protein MXB_1367 [Myxobolus squamalis]
MLDIAAAKPHNEAATGSQVHNDDNSGAKSLVPESIGHVFYNLLYRIDKNLSIFVSNVDFTCSDGQLLDIFSTVAPISKAILVRNSTGISKGYGYVQFVDSVKKMILKIKNDVQKALGKDRKLKIGVRPIYISPISIDREQRQPKFRHQGFKECRLSTYRNGNSRGFAYVEFITKEHAAGTLLKEDGAFLRGQAISIHVSNPPIKKGLEPADGITYLGKRRANVELGSSKQTNICTTALSNNDFRRFIKKTD